MGETTHLRPRSRRAVGLALTALAIVVVALLALAVAGDSAYRDSKSALLPVEQRMARARTATCLAPWVATYRARYLALAGWVRGRNLLEAGDYSGAVNALRDAYRLDVGEKELLVLFQRAQDVEALATTRKAHLQHGHEGPGSTLRPQDIER
jgi:hypothetical protein